MKKFISWLLTILVFYTQTNIFAFAQTNVTKEITSNSIETQDDVFRGHAEIYDKQEKANDKIFTG